MTFVNVKTAELKKSLECYCPDKKFGSFVSSKFQISEHDQLARMVVKLEELKLFIESEYIRPENTINMMKQFNKYVLELEDNNVSFYVLSALLSCLLEEISTFKTEDFCYTTNGFQFSTMKDLVLRSIDALKDENNDWQFLLDG